MFLIDSSPPFVIFSKCFLTIRRSRFGLFSPRKQPTVRPAVHLDTINWLTPVRPEMVISCSSDRVCNCDGAGSTYGNV